MRINYVGCALLGGMIVYVAIAACGNDGAAPLLSRDAGALVDVLTDPVSRADAQTEPVVTTEPCDKLAVFEAGLADVVQVYAEHAFPGLTKLELTRRVHAMAHLVDTNRTIDGYDDFVANVAYVRDGSVAVFCGTTMRALYDSVTFTLSN